jgi:hypothetical protein
VSSDCLRRILQSLESNVIKTNLQLEVAILSEHSTSRLKLNDKNRLPLTLGGLNALLPPQRFTITLSSSFDKTRPQAVENFGVFLQSSISEFPEATLFSVEPK